MMDMIRARRRKFNVDEYYRMAEVGILHEDSNVELIEGEIMEKHPVGRRRFTADEYLRMGEAGILHEDDRVELIGGEILEMAVIGNRHLACVNRLTRLFVERLGRAVVVHVQNPVRLSESSEPETDVTLLRPRADFYARKRPTPEDVLLLIEVSDTTLEFDRDVKVPLYARSIARGGSIAPSTLPKHRLTGSPGFREVLAAVRFTKKTPEQKPGGTKPAAN